MSSDFALPQDRIKTPDNWIVFKDPENNCYRILAGWSGGYLDSHYWRINSGISYVECEDGHYLFFGHSGSCYKCVKGRYKLRPNNYYVWEKLKQESKNKVNILPEDTNWCTFKWG